MVHGDGLVKSRGEWGRETEAAGADNRGGPVRPEEILTGALTEKTCVHRIKIEFFDTIYRYTALIPTVLFGLHILPVTLSQIHALDAVQRRMLRSVATTKQGFARSGFRGLVPWVAAPRLYSSRNEAEEHVARRDAAHHGLRRAVRHARAKLGRCPRAPVKARISIARR